MNSKALLISVRSQSAGHSYLLVDAEQSVFMGVACVKGRHFSTTTKHDWINGQTIYIPLDAVLSVVEYESVEAYRDTMRRYNEAQLQ